MEARDPVQLNREHAEPTRQSNQSAGACVSFYGYFLDGEQFQPNPIQSLPPTISANLKEVLPMKTTEFSVSRPIHYKSPNLPENQLKLMVEVD